MPTTTEIFSKGGITSDAFVLIGLFIIFLVFTLYFGKNRMISFILAFYPAVFLYKSVPFNTQTVSSYQIVAFFIFFIAINMIVNRFISDDFTLNNGSNIFQSSVYALGGVILVLVFSYNLVNLDSFYNFSPQIDLLFSDLDKIFWWSIAPFALLAFI